MTILVAYVPRPEGKAALEKGLEIAKRRGERLLVVNTSTGGHQEDDALATSAEVDWIEAYLAQTGLEAQFKQFVRGKDVVEELNYLVHTQSVSLVVIGLRRRTAVGKLILGSNAHDILMNVDGPILTVKAH